MSRLPDPSASTPPPPGATAATRRAAAAVFLVTIAACAGSPARPDRPDPLPPTAATGPTPDGAGIVEVAAPPRVDGALREWTAHPALPVPWRDGAGQDAPARAWLAFDDLRLYVALEVPDDTLVFPERAWRFGDGFYLTVLMPGGGEASPVHVSFGFSRVGERLEKVAVNRSGEYFPRLSMEAVELAMRPAPHDLPLDADGVAPWHEPVTYEVAVPWSLLAPAGPLLVDSLAVNIVVSEQDGDGRRSFAQLAPDRDFDTERTPVRRGRMLPLLRRPRTDAPPALAAALPTPVLTAAAPVAVRVALRDPTGLPAAVRVGVARDGAALGAVHGQVPPGAGVRRVTVPLRLDAGTGTGAVTVRVATDGGLETELAAFVVDRTQLAALRARLEALERETGPGDVDPAVAAAAATALIRVEWLEDLAASAGANSPLGAARAWWRELSRLDPELASGRVDSLHRDSVPPRLAHRSALDGTLQPYSVRLPRDYDPARPGGYPLLVALHGSGVDERGTIRTVGAAARERDWIVVAPRARGLSDWYVGDAEADVLEAIDHAATLYPVDTTRVALAGFSMGGYGAWRLALRHPHRFRATAVLAGAACPPAHVRGECVPELLAGAVQERTESPAGTPPSPPFLLAHGALDGAVPVDDARALARALEAVRWPHVYREFPETAHGDPRWWGMALDWLEEHVAAGAAEPGQDATKSP